MGLALTSFCPVRFGCGALRFKIADRGPIGDCLRFEVNAAEQPSKISRSVFSLSLPCFRVRNLVPLLPCFRVEIRRA